MAFDKLKAQTSSQFQIIHMLAALMWGWLKIQIAWASYSYYVTHNQKEPDYIIDSSNSVLWFQIFIWFNM